MLNVKEVTELLKSEGITDNKQTVIRWILDGKIKARRTKGYNIDFSIHPSDIVSFIVEKKIESKSKQFGVDFQRWEKTFYENQRLIEKLEELKALVRIEKAKVGSLKKMLLAEYTLNSSAPPNFYSIFGIDESADKDLLKKEFKKILKSLHPDRGGDERLFKVFYDHYKKTI